MRRGLSLRGSFAHKLRGLIARGAGSVRVRVTATALLAVGCALAVSAGFVDAALRHDRQHMLYTTAQQQARDVVALNPQLDRPLLLPREATIDSGLVQVLRDGQVVGASIPLRHLPPLWPPGTPAAVTARDALADRPDVHVVAVPVRAGRIRGTVVVVASLEQYDHSLAFVQRLLLVGTPVLLVIVGAICWLIVGRALRPIEMMRLEVAGVAGATGGHRVAEPANDDEVGRLARTLNSMLDRIQASSARERRFVSDASHELRSPIANIRTELEVALRHPEVTDWQQVAEEVLGQNDRMERLVSALLLLARSDEGSLMAAPEPVDLAAVAQSVVASTPAAARTAPHRGAPAVELRGTPTPVRVPQVYLERMVGNLVDNAARFAATCVVVSVDLEGRWGVVRVRDDGPGVPEQDRDRIFERFVRLDEARDRDEGGFGLGLAIVADLTRFYGGSIQVLPASPGAEFVLRLPAHPVAAVDGTDPTPAVPAPLLPAGNPADEAARHGRRAAEGAQRKATTPASVGTRSIPSAIAGDAKLGTPRPTEEA